MPPMFANRICCTFKLMQGMGDKKIYFRDNWGLFIGSFTNNVPHGHYAVQLSISLGTDIRVFDGENKPYHYGNYIIKSNVPHRVVCKGEQLLILFNPTSTTGHFLNGFSTYDIAEFDHTIVERLKESCLNYTNNTMDFESTIGEITRALEVFKCACQEQDHFDDERIRTAMHYLEENVQRIVPLHEVAGLCFLSPSRFLHLFKEKTGISFRKAQQWNRISQSFKVFFQQSLTQTAHEFGFTDSAHYTRVFKETFGFSPRQVQKK